MMHMTIYDALIIDMNADQDKLSSINFVKQEFTKKNQSLRRNNVYMLPDKCKILLHNILLKED